MTTLASDIEWFEPPEADGIGRINVAGANDAELAEAVRSAAAAHGLRGLLVVVGETNMRPSPPNQRISKPPAATWRLYRVRRSPQSGAPP